jgi:hypothetical protein
MMNNSDFFANTDTHLHNFIRQYSGELKPNNIDNVYLTQSSRPSQVHKNNPNNDQVMNEEFQRGSDVRSLIEQLMTKKKMGAPAPLPPIGPISLNPSRPVLVNTEHRIFQEVVNLMLEISDIKESIKKEKEQTAQIEMERNSILNKGNEKYRTKKQTDFEMEPMPSK